MGACGVNLVRKDAFSYYPQLDRVQTFCNENYHETISLKDVAGIAGLERTYFSTFFRTKVGVCFSCWLGLLRVDAAKRKIELNNRAMSQVAFDVGYSSLGTFERSFKRHTGMTPSQYKNLVRPC